MLISKFNSSHFNYHMAIVLHTNDDDDDMRDYADAKVVKTRKHDNNHASHWKCYKGQWIRIKIQMCYILCVLKIFWWSYFLAYRNFCVLSLIIDLSLSLVLLFPCYNYFIYPVLRTKAIALYITFFKILINHVMKEVLYRLSTEKENSW